jgi:hypothetical protein
MDMDDDDFMGNIEFSLTPEQSAIVSQAIDLASKDTDAFRNTNPLISIMQWWQTQPRKSAEPSGSPESTLAEACRLFVLAHRRTP